MACREAGREGGREDGAGEDARVERKRGKRREGAWGRREGRRCLQRKPRQSRARPRSLSRRSLETMSPPSLLPSLPSSFPPCVLPSAAESKVAGPEGIPGGGQGLAMERREGRREEWRESMRSPWSWMSCEDGREEC
jgi:hypothetical protein